MEFYIVDDEGEQIINTVLDNIDRRAEDVADSVDQENDPNFGVSFKIPTDEDKDISITRLMRQQFILVPRTNGVPWYYGFKKPDGWIEIVNPIQEVTGADGKVIELAPFGELCQIWPLVT